MLIERRLNAFDLAISWALCCSRTKEQPECALNSCDWDGEDNGKKKKKEEKGNYVCIQFSFTNRPDPK